MNSDSIGKFCGSVLLSEDCWDKNKLIKDLRDEWNIEIPSEDLTDEADVQSLQISMDIGWLSVNSRLPCQTKRRKSMLPIIICGGKR